MGLKVTLIKSPSSASAKQVATVKGLGVWKFGSQKLLKDTPAIRGMLDRVQHLVKFEVVKYWPGKKCGVNCCSTAVEMKAELAIQ